jgi:predicted NBD/HSP70 family sugar kinase
MAHFVGLDVSVLETAVCVVDETGKVICEQKVPSEPDDIVTLLTSIGEAIDGAANNQDCGSCLGEQNRQNGLGADDQR